MIELKHIVLFLTRQARWARALSSQLPSGTSNSCGARLRSTGPRALVVDAWVPRPDKDSGSVRMMGLLHILQELGLQVTFIPSNLLSVSPYTERMQELGIECVHAPFLAGVDTFLLEHGQEFDLILLSRANIAEEILPLSRKYASATPVVFDSVDLQSLRQQREAEIGGDEGKREEARAMEALEVKLGRETDAIVVVSSVEKMILAEKLPNARVAVISNIHEIHPTKAPFESRRGFLFIGCFEHTPNEDAVAWFCGEIMPKVLRALPDTIFHIIGSNMPASVRALATDHIIPHGYVENVELFFETCLLSVVPLRYGAGVKGKTNQSMSFGLPVVSTTVGAEGMHLTHEKDVLLADTAEDFASQVVRLHRDRELWMNLSREGLENIQEHFSPAKAKRSLEELLLKLRVLKPPRKELLHTLN